MSDLFPSSTAPVTRSRTWLGWLLLGAVLVVTAGVAILLDRLRERGDECRRAQMNLAFLRADAHQLSALEWETIARKELTEESSAHLAVIQTRMDDRFRGLGLLALSPPQSEELRKSYRTYVRLVEQEFKLIAAGTLEAAEEFDEAEVDPAFDALETALEEMGDVYDKAAVRTLRLTSAGTLLVLLGGVGFIVLLVWQFNKKWHKAEVAAAGERALVQANQKLELRVRERTAELSALNREMECRVAERTRELQQSNHTLEAELAQRTRAEGALRESEARFRDLFENATDLIQIVSPDGHFAFVNRAWKQALGYTDEERSNLTVFDIVDGSSKEHCTDAFRRLTNGEEVPVVEAVFVGKQGRRIMVEGHVTCRRLDGKPGNTRGIFRDVTARKEAEKTLQRMRDQHALILNSVSEGVHGLDLDGRLTFENPASAAMLGYEILDLTGKPEHATMHHTRPDGTPYPPGECPIHASLKDGVVRQVRGEVFWRRDGTSFPVDYTSTPLRDVDGTIVGATVVFTDITERNRAQAELDDIHKQLVEASREAGMAEVAANVLHNVGNVLNSVNVSAGLVVESVKKSRASSLARVVALLQEHAHDLGTFLTQDSRGKHVPAHLAQLSEHLLADQAAMVGELDSLRRNVEHIKEIVAMQQSYARVGGVKEIINVVDLVQDSLRMNENALSRHRVEVIREFEPVPPMNLEKHKVLQILVNLVRNAKHACQDSERADKRLTMRVANSAGRVKISVMDNGVGIPPENLTRIFSHGFTTRKSGHGFGLHSGALAARELGGSLTVHSDGPGQGAAFTLELPAPRRENSHDS